MILLNTTFSVDNNIADDFIGFIREAYIPIAHASGLYAALLTELRAPTEDNALTHEHTRTFALQMRAPSQRIATEFHDDVLPNIYHEMGSMWGMGVAMFESTLDVLHDPSKQ